MRCFPLALSLTLVTACGGSPPAPAPGPAPAPSPATAVAPAQAAPEKRGMELPRVAVDGTVAATSWTFIKIDAAGVRVGAVPASAVSEAGVDIAQLGDGERVEPSEVGRAARMLLGKREATEPQPPPPPKKPRTKPKLERCKKDDFACERRNAVEQARAAGILGEEPAYPSCGDAMQGLTGASGDGRPLELAPMHALACPLETPDKTANYAALLLADRDARAATVIAPFISDSGVALVRFGVTVDGTHARTIAVQLGQNRGYGPLPLRPPADRVIVLDAKADPGQLATRAQSGTWIWVRGDARYGQLAALVHAITAANVSPIVMSVDDPR